MAKGRETTDKDANGYSGRLLLRMPPELHAEAARVAEREGVSLNQFITGALAEAVGSPADDGAGAGSAQNGTEARAASPRLITAALAVNFVVVAVAGAVAITLLIVAWQRGL
jgi:HicB family